MRPTPSADLGHVYWIGGVTTAGKTTVARLLAARHGLQVYSTDDHFDRHAREADSGRQPALYAYQHDDEWLAASRALPVQSRTFLWLRVYGERFDEIVRELAARQAPVIAEGVDLLPDRVAAVAPPPRAVWLVPSRARFDRAWPARERAVPDLDAAWRYYGLMVWHTRRLAARSGFEVLEVDGTSTPDALADRLASRFGLA